MKYYETKEEKEIRGRLEDLTREQVKLKDKLEALQNENPKDDEIVLIVSRLDYIDEKKKEYINLLNQIS